MARRKPTNLHHIKDLAEANAVLAEIAGIRRTLGSIEDELNTRIDKAKQLAEATAAKHLSRLEALENGLLAFAEYNKDELFAERRSRELDFGTLGYRRSCEIKAAPKVTLAMVLGKCKELGFEKAIRTKEELNKEELHTWSAERLALVGARRVEKDSFWFEVNEQKIQEDAA